MTSSRAASVIFALLALLMIAIGWLAVFRKARIDRLRERLEKLRDMAFDAARHAGVPADASVVWLEMLARHAESLTAGRFLLVWLFARPSSPVDSATEDLYSSQAAAIVRRHLIWGFAPLALIPRHVLENRQILRLTVESGVR